MISKGQVKVKGGGGGKRVTALSLQAPGSGQVQCTSRSNFAPFYHLDIQRHYASVRARGTAGDRQWVRDT